MTKLGTAMNATDTNARMLSSTEPRCVAAIDAERNADQPRRGRSPRTSGSACRGAPRRSAPATGRPEITSTPRLPVSDVREEPPQPDGERLVEPHLRDEAPRQLRRGLRSEQRGRGIAGDDGRQREQQQHRADHDQHRRDEAARRGSAAPRAVASRLPRTSCARRRRPARCQLVAPNRRTASRSSPAPPPGASSCGRRACWPRW